MKGLSNPIILFLDLDEAGIQGTLSIGKELYRSNKHIYVARYPEEAYQPEEPDGLNAAQIGAAISGKLRWRNWQNSIRTSVKDSERA